MRTSRLYNKNVFAYNSGKNIIVNKGGTRSGKTFSILQMLYLIAKCNQKKPKIISVVSETLPHLKRGCIRDFNNILEDAGETPDQNKSTNTYYFGKNIIEFFSADNSEKVKGAQRNILFINECNRIPYETIRQLMVRTSGKKIFDYNPVCDFWINDKILNRDNVALIHSTYKDNPFLTPEQIAEIESNKNDANWWRVYGLGLEGQLDGLIYPDFEQVDEMPDAQFVYGLDFGFMNDQTALIEVAIIGDRIFANELLYNTGLTNSDLSKQFELKGLTKRQSIIIADNAELKSIEELYRSEWNIKPCIKGKGSIIAGINLIKKYKLCITKRSTNLIHELRNYMWEKDKNDNLINVPIDKFNHALDALRYAVNYKLNQTFTPAHARTAKLPMV